MLLAGQIQIHVFPELNEGSSGDCCRYPYLQSIKFQELQICVLQNVNLLRSVNEGSSTLFNVSWFSPANRRGRKTSQRREKREVEREREIDHWLLTPSKPRR